MRVIVCGGRDYDEPEIIAARLDRLHGVEPITLLIQGGATGADKHAARWARLTGIRVMTYPAAWHLHGKAAGPIRNKRMLDEQRPSLVVAFYGGRGTADMVNQAKAAGVAVLDLREVT